MIVNKIIIVMFVQLAHGGAAFPNHGGFPSRPHNKLAGRKKKQTRFEADAPIHTCMHT